MQRRVSAVVLSLVVLAAAPARASAGGASAIPVPLPPPDVLVTVVDASGGRVAAATVSGWNGERLFVTARTDENGCCRIGMSLAPSGRCDLRAEMADLRSRPLRAQAGEAVVLRLQETLSFVVRVVEDVTGQRLPGCSIGIGEWNRTRGEEYSDTRIAACLYLFTEEEEDWHSRFPADQRFVTQDDGACRVRAAMPLVSILAVKPGYLTRELQGPETEALGDAEFVIRMTPAPSMLIHLHDAEGQDVAGARFGERDWTGRFRAAPCRVLDVSGRQVYEVTLDPHRWFEIRAEGWASRRLLGRPFWLEDREVLGLEMLPGAMVVGRIEDPDLLTCPMVNVWSEAKEPYFRARTGFSVQPAPDGSFCVEGVARGREYRYEVFEEWASIGSGLFSVGKDEDVVDLGIVPATPLTAGETTVGGVVMEKGGGPLAGVWIASDRQAVLSDGDGRFQLRSARGVEDVEVCRIGYECARGRLLAGRTTLIRLRPMNLVEGQVVDERGLPVPFARVSFPSLGPISSLLAPAWRTWTDETGRFAIRRKGPRLPSLLVDAEGCHVASSTVHANKAFLTVLVCKSVRVPVQVERGAGLEPPRGGQWEVRACTVHTPWSSTQQMRIPAGERAAWLWLAPGTYEVHVSVPGHDLATVRAEVSAGGSNVVCVDANGE